MMILLLLSTGVPLYAQEAYAVAIVTVKNQQKMSEYLEKAVPIINHYSGEVIVNGRIISMLHGQRPGESLAVAKFPSEEHIHQFYDSDAYQAIIPLRDDAADITFFTLK